MPAITQELFDDEFTREVRDGYVRLLVRGVPDDEATDAILYEQRYSALMSAAHGALLWLALALTQARHGRRSELVHRRALRALDDPHWVESWSDAGHPLADRRALLDAVRHELAQPPRATPAIEIELTYCVEPLDDAHQAWIHGCRDTLRAVAPDIDLTAPPARLVREAARRLDTARTELIHADSDRTSASIALIGVLWGEQLVRTAAWEWASVVDAGGMRTVMLARRDRAALVSPFHLPTWHLEDPDGASNVLVELFETLRLAAPAPSAHGLLLPLRDFARRLADPRWIEQREQLLAGSTDAALAGATGGGVDAAMLGDLETLGRTAHLASSGSTGVLVDGGRRPPSAAVVVRRALVLRALVEHALSAMAPDVARVIPSEAMGGVQATSSTHDARLAQLRATGLWEVADDGERAMLATPASTLDDEQLLELAWRAEGLGCLLWALGQVNDVPPYDEPVRGEMLLALSAPYASTAAADHAVLRSPGEIENARTVAELWHWRSNTRERTEARVPFPCAPEMPMQSWDDVVRYTAPQALERGLIGAVADGDFRAFGRAYRDLSAADWDAARRIARERHRALNWLCGYAPANRWSATPFET